MAKTAETSPAGYACFSDFFTRALRDGVRPLAHADLVIPVDGSRIPCGAVEGDPLLQAKDHGYSLRALVSGDDVPAARFRDRHQVSLHLSPKDCHRIHMPCDRRILRMVPIPGRLFSVNPTTVRGVPGLFVRRTGGLRLRV